MDYQSILEEVEKFVASIKDTGNVADYIPALASVSKSKFAMAIKLVNGEEYFVGDFDDDFSIQSISKLIPLAILLHEKASVLGPRVGIEPSGSAFNSLVQLETENGIPRNPFINAGAIVVTDALCSLSSTPKEDILNFVSKLTGNKNIEFNQNVAKSEELTGYRNRALANFIRSYGNLDNMVNEVLDVYYNQCSLAMSCKDLVRLFLFLANNGIHSDGSKVLGFRNTKKVNSLLMTCGTYDAVGNFAYKVGIPAKSGVGGGIVAIIPRLMSIAVWSPGLDEAGNSKLGMAALEHFTTLTGNSVF